MKEHHQKSHKGGHQSLVNEKADESEINEEEI